MTNTIDGVVYTSSKSWSGPEEELLQQHWGSLGMDELVRLLNRPMVLIKRKAKALGLLENTRWTDVETGTLARNSNSFLSILKEYFPQKSYEQIARKRNKICELPFSKSTFIAELVNELNYLLQAQIWSPVVVREMSNELNEIFNPKVETKNAE